MDGAKAIGIAFTENPVMALGGLPLFVAVAKHVGLVAKLGEVLPFPVIPPRATPPAHVLRAFFAGVLAGAGRFAQLGVLRVDESVRALFGLRRLPSTATFEPLFAWCLARLPERPVGWTLVLDCKIQDLRTDLRALLPAYLRLILIRADSGFFEEAILLSFEALPLPYIVVAQFTNPLQAAKYRLAFRPSAPGFEVGELVCQAHRWVQARRLIAIREELTRRAARPPRWCSAPGGGWACSRHQRRSRGAVVAPGEAASTTNQSTMRGSLRSGGPMTALRREPPPSSEASPPGVSPSIA